MIAFKENSASILNFETSIPNLTILDKEIADALKQSRDLGISAVTKAYDLYNGDFAAFTKGPCFAYMDQQVCLETIEEYDVKSQEMGMSALELNSTTAKTLATKLAGRAEVHAILWKLKRAIEKRIERKRESYGILLQKYWVRNISNKSCQEFEILYSYDRKSLVKELRDQASLKNLVYRKH